MKVICINASRNINTHPSLKDLLVEGEVYTVIFEAEGLGNDGTYQMNYVLEEFPHPYSFLKSRFIPLSNIDELELINNKELVNES